MSKVSFQPSCRSCVYWEKPAKTPARADYAYPCSAPVPMGNIPASVFGTLDKRRMTRDEGRHCPAWHPKNLAALAPAKEGQ